MNLFFSGREDRSALQCVAGEDSLVDLYAEYNRVLCLPSDDSYSSIILQDIPRTFPGKIAKYSEGVRRLLDAFVRYSPVGYIQGHNFLATAAVLFFRGRVPYMSFWLFVSLFDNLKHVYLLPIDATFQQKDKLFAEDTEHVVRVFLALYKNKHGVSYVSNVTVLSLKNIVQWRIIGTLLMSFCKDPTFSKMILLHFMPVLHDREAFRSKAAATALAFLLCCFLEKELNEDVILTVQGGNLTKDGLESILRTAPNVSSLV